MRCVLVRTGIWRHRAPEVPGEELEFFEQDMYTDLFDQILAELGATGEVWYLGVAKKDRVFSPRLSLRMFDRSPLSTPFDADLVWFRAQYDCYKELRFNCSPMTMYYGAGGRKVCPVRSYDLILADTASQMKKVHRTHPSAAVVTWTKPASHAFEVSPAFGSEKRFDYCLVAGTQGEWKGFDWAVRSLPRGSSVLRVGPRDPWFLKAKHLEVYFTGMVPKERVPWEMTKARVGLICDSERSSGPRVIAEFLALGIPVLLRPTVVCSSAYSATTVVVSDFLAQFLKLSKLSPDAVRREYDKFNLRSTAAYLARIIRETIAQRRR